MERIRTLINRLTEMFGQLSKREQMLVSLAGGAFVVFVSAIVYGTMASSISRHDLSIQEKQLQLQQIAVNLLVNAIQAMGGTGQLTVGCGPAASGRVKLWVADSGPGVPPEHAKRIFEPFFTTKPEGQGTGLGLSICYQIAEEHGGAIRLEQAERGACFVLELPASEPAATA